jgi:hypothetical protein
LTEDEERLDGMDGRFSSKNVKICNAPGQKIVEVPAMDPRNEDKTLPFRHINNGTVRDDLPERKQLVSEIIQRLDQYGKHIKVNNFFTWPLIWHRSNSIELHIDA